MFEGSRGPQMIIKGMWNFLFDLDSCSMSSQRSIIMPVECTLNANIWAKSKPKAYGLVDESSKSPPPMASPSRRASGEFHQGEPPLSFPRVAQNSALPNKRRMECATPKYNTYYSKKRTELLACYQSNAIIISIPYLAPSFLQ